MLPLFLATLLEVNGIFQQVVLFFLMWKHKYSIIDIVKHAKMWNEKCNAVKFAKDFSIKEDDATKWKADFGFIWHDWEVHEDIVNIKQKLQKIKWQLEQLYQDTKQQKSNAQAEEEELASVYRAQSKEKHTLILQSMLFYWEYNAIYTFMILFFLKLF